MLHGLIYGLYGLQSALLNVVWKALMQLEDHFLLNDEFRERPIIQFNKKDEVLNAEFKNYLHAMEDSTVGLRFGNFQRAEWFAKMQEHDMLKDTPAEDLWLHDLGVLEEELDVSFVFLRKYFFLSFWVSSNLNLFCV